MPPWIIRLSSDEPPLRGYYAGADGGVEPVATLGSLEEVLAQESPPLDAGQVAAARADFDERAAELLKREREVQETRKRAEEVALQERGRHLLLQATYIDLAMSAHAELFGVAPNLAGFTEEAAKALARHGYPFAPLIRLVGTEGVVPVPTDPFFVKIQDASQEGLRKRFEVAKGRVEELVQRLTQALLARPLR